MSESTRFDTVPQAGQSAASPSLIGLSFSKRPRHTGQEYS